MPSGYENVTGGARYPANLLSIFMGWPVRSPTARGFFTRPPTGTPRRAISPGEGLLFPYLHHHTFSPKGVAGLSFTARIGRATFHRARSASKKDGLAAPYPLLCASYPLHYFIFKGSLVDPRLRASYE